MERSNLTKDEGVLNRAIKYGVWSCLPPPTGQLCVQLHYGFHISHLELSVILKLYG